MTFLMFVWVGSGKVCLVGLYVLGAKSATLKSMAGGPQ